MCLLPFTQSWTPLFLYTSCTRQWKDKFLIDWTQNTQTRGVLFMRESWEAYNTCSSDSWGNCRTPNCSSPSSCLHVYRAWLRGLALSVRGRAIVSVVRRMCKISRCAASSSGHTAIFIKLVWGSLEKIGPQKLLSCNLYTCVHHLSYIYSVGSFYFLVG